MTSAREVIVEVIVNEVCAHVSKGQPILEDYARAESILSALESAGWAMVPVEPNERQVTDGMIAGACAVEGQRMSRFKAREVYRAMLSAAKEG